jgi:hypothetical protein
VALVDVRVEVDEGRQDHAAAEVGGRRRAGEARERGARAAGRRRRRRGGRDAVDQPIADLDVHEGETVDVGLEGGEVDALEAGEGDARAAEDVAAGRRDGGGVAGRHCRRRGAGRLGSGARFVALVGPSSDHNGVAARVITPSSDDVSISFRESRRRGA